MGGGASTVAGVAGVNAPSTSFQAGAIAVGPAGTGLARVGSNTVAATSLTGIDIKGVNISEQRGRELSRDKNECAPILDDLQNGPYNEEALSSRLSQDQFLKIDGCCKAKLAIQISIQREQDDLLRYIATESADPEMQELANNSEVTARCNVTRHNDIGFCNYARSANPEQLETQAQNLATIADNPVYETVMVNNIAIKRLTPNSKALVNKVSDMMELVKNAEGASSHTLRVVAENFKPNGSPTKN